jgi:hypothetical protein
MQSLDDAGTAIAMPLEIAAARPEVQAHYLKMIAAGQSPRFAEMCALGAAPAVHGTDDAWMRGRKNAEWMDGLPKKQAQWMLREARAAGIATEGKYYMSGLANQRAHLDAEAWVGSRSDVLRVAKKRRLEVKGQINYTPPEGVAPPQRRGLNPKLVRELAKKEMAKNPALKRSEAVALVKERHTPHWAKNRG